jgi:hypothetical protein
MNPKARFSGVSEDEKQSLRRYLQEAREALLWKLDGCPTTTSGGR